MNKDQLHDPRAHRLETERGLNHSGRTAIGAAGAKNAREAMACS